jgi:hypothetical protein
LWCNLFRAHNPAEENAVNKKKLSANQLVLVALAICGTYAYLVFTSKSSPESNAPAMSAASAEAITRRCAVAAGVDPDAKGHAMTAEQIRSMADCAKRHTSN